MVGKILTEVTEQNFDEEVLNSDLPVFACFTTSWCYSCFPTCFVVDELANQYEGQLKFVRIDKEKTPEISAKYNIIVVPSIILFQDSVPVKKLLGYQKKTSLSDLLDALLAEIQTSTSTFNRDDEKTADDQSDSP